MITSQRASSNEMSYSNSLPSHYPIPPSTPPIARVGSRNDLFALNWSPTAPHLSPATKMKLSQSVGIPLSSHKMKQSPSTALIPPLSIQIPKVDDINSPNSPFSPRYTETNFTPRSIAAHLPVPEPIEKSKEIPFNERERFKLKEITRLRLEMRPDYLLGEGRSSTVYLGAFQTDLEEKWKFCAAKKNFDQSNCLEEAYLLSRLSSINKESTFGSGGEYIIKCYGIIDENQIEGLPNTEFRVKKVYGLGSGLIRSGSLNSTKNVNLFRQSSTKLPSKSNFFNKTEKLQTLIGSPNIDESQSELPSLAPTHIIQLKKKSIPRPRYSAPPLPTEPATVQVELDSAFSREVRLNSSDTITAMTIEKEESCNSSIILLLEYASLGNLSDFIKNYPERMNRKRWITWAKQIALAVAWIHENNLLHADLKTQNILITQDLQIRIADFGISIFLNSPTQDLNPIGLGTPAYSPPEFVQSPIVPFSFPADIFSLGVLFSVMISGVEPYTGLRSLERMLLVTRGGYHEWEERRRINSLEFESNFSRRNSIKSNRSSNFSHSNGNSGSGTGLGIGRMRADSIESSFSNRRESLDFTRAGFCSAELAQRLLSEEEREEEWKEGGREEDLDFEGEHILSFLPPASPLLGEETNQAEEIDEDIPLYNANNPSTYPASGEIYQYFLNGELVEEEIRNLIKSMTVCNPGSRPSIDEVLEALEKLVGV